MKHISEILPKALYKITGIEREYLLNYIKNMEIEMKVLRDENKFLKGHCVSCGVNLGAVRNNKKYCPPCSADAKIEQQRKFVIKATEPILAECIDCGCPVTTTRQHAGRTRCKVCKPKFMKESIAAAKLKKSSLDPLGDVLAEQGVKFYDVSKY